MSGRVSANLAGWEFSCGTRLLHLPLCLLPETGCHFLPHCVDTACRHGKKVTTIGLVDHASVASNRTIMGIITAGAALNAEHTVALCTLDPIVKRRVCNPQYGSITAFAYQFHLLFFVKCCSGYDVVTVVRPTHETLGMNGKHQRINKVWVQK